MIDGVRGGGTVGGCPCVSSSRAVHRHTRAHTPPWLCTGDRPRRATGLATTHNCRDRAAPLLARRLAAVRPQRPTRALHAGLVRLHAATGAASAHSQGAVCAAGARPCCSGGERTNEQRRGWHGIGHGAHGARTCPGRGGACDRQQAATAAGVAAAGGGAAVCGGRGAAAANEPAKGRWGCGCGCGAPTRRPQQANWRVRGGAMLQHCWCVYSFLQQKTKQHGCWCQQRQTNDRRLASRGSVASRAASSVAEEDEDASERGVTPGQESDSG